MCENSVLEGHGFTRAVIATAMLCKKNISKKGPLNRRSLHYAPPDFLLRVVALIKFMRFPLRETATVALVSAAK